MALNVGQLAATMVAAALGVIKKRSPQIAQYAETEFTKIAQTIAGFEKLRLTKDITDQEAQLHLQMAANASRSVLLTVEGLGLLEAEAAINAALAAVKTVVNKALGFALI